MRAPASFPSLLLHPPPKRCRRLILAVLRTWNLKGAGRGPALSRLGRHGESGRYGVRSLMLWAWLVQRNKTFTHERGTCYELANCEAGLRWVRNLWE